MDNETIQALKDKSNAELANIAKFGDSNQTIISSTRVITLAIYSVTETLNEILGQLKAIDSSIDLNTQELQRIEKTIDFIERS